jgi:hypothetical protein
VQASLTEAVAALTAFQNEKWLPARAGHTAVATTPSASAKGKTVQKREPSESEATDLSTVVSDSESAPSVTDATDETSNGSPGAPDPLARIVATAATTETTTSSSSSSSSSPDAEDDDPAEDKDDPQTREPVHSAVLTTMEAYVMVLCHAAKTNRGCELAMEGVHMLVSKQYLSGRAGGKDDASGSGSKAAAALKSHGTELPRASLLHRLVDSIAKTSESNVDAVQTGVVRTLRAIMTSPKCGVHEGTMLLALRSTFHVYLVTKSPGCKQLAKTALLDMLRSVFFRMEAYEIMARGRGQARKIADASNSNGNGNDAKPKSAGEEGADGEAEDTSDAPSAFPSQYHTDSYVLLGSLCKMCSKELPVDVGAEPDRARLFNTQVPTDPLALNSKILSLELILAAMDYSGDAFVEGEKFIYLVQSYLCVVLLKNCVSSHTQVAFLSQKIFLVLVSIYASLTCTIDIVIVSETTRPLTLACATLS